MYISLEPNPWGRYAKPSVNTFNLSFKTCLKPSNKTMKGLIAYKAVYVLDDLERKKLDNLAPSLKKKTI